MIKGYSDTLLDDFVPESAENGIYLDKDCASIPATCRWRPAAVHAGQMGPLLHYLGEDVVVQLGGGTIGDPGGIAAGAEAIRVATEAMIEARNEGRDHLNENDDILKQAAKKCPALDVALDLWARSASTTSPPTAASSTRCTPYAYAYASDDAHGTRYQGDGKGPEPD